ncbi:MAG: phenylphosphate carboxylase subunit delta [Hydrogenophilus sp.]|nr:phenylphosphate carboxylase subunit delta [Hydrogenophilus sp.]
MTARDRAARVRLMAFDIDGVLTDGRLYFGPEGELLKSFHVQDGHGLKLLMRSGVQVALISGRHSSAVERRAAELGIRHLIFDCDDKRAALAELLAQHHLTWDEAGFMGDDLVDLAPMALAIFAAAPADAHPEALARAHYITVRAGGQGAVREVCDYLLTAQGHLERLIAEMLP